VSFYVSTATFFLLHCDEWDRVVALPRHKFVTGATLLQLVGPHWDSNPLSTAPNRTRYPLHHRCGSLNQISNTGSEYSISASFVTHGWLQFDTLNSSPGDEWRASEHDQSCMIDDDLHTGWLSVAGGIIRLVVSLSTLTLFMKFIVVFIIEVYSS
jgi:hypothetical protein